MRYSGNWPKLFLYTIVVANCRIKFTLLNTLSRCRAAEPPGTFPSLRRGLPSNLTYWVHPELRVKACSNVAQTSARLADQ